MIKKGCVILLLHGANMYFLTVGNLYVTQSDTESDWIHVKNDNGDLTYYRDLLYQILIFP